MGHEEDAAAPWRACAPTPISPPIGGVRHAPRARPKSGPSSVLRSRERRKERWM
jgi:hypothetical protein